MRARRTILLLAIAPSLALAARCDVDPVLFDSQHKPRFGTLAVKKSAAPGPALSAPVPAIRMSEQAGLDEEHRQRLRLYEAIADNDVARLARLLPRDPGERIALIRRAALFASAASHGSLAVLRKMLEWDPALPTMAKAISVEGLARNWGEGRAPAPPADRVETLRLLLEWGATVEGSNELGGPLYWLARTRHPAGSGAAAELLLQRGARIESRTGKPEHAPWRTAAVAGNGEVLAALHKHRPLTALQLEEALHHTPIRQDATALAVLLAAGADINADPQRQRYPGFQPLADAATRAVEHGEKEPLRLVLRHVRGPRADAAQALVNALPKRDVLQTMLDAGVDVNARDPQGRTVLAEVDGSDDAVLRLLLARGATIHPPAIGSQPIGPAGWALLSGHEAVAIALVQRDGLVAADCGLPYYAAQRGATRVLDALIDRGLPLHEAMDPHNRTAFFVAVAKGRLDAMRLLLERRAATVDAESAKHTETQWSRGHFALFARPYQMQIGGERPLQVALQSRQVEAARELLQRGADPWGPGSEAPVGFPETAALQQLVAQYRATRRPAGR